jgi:predicted DCC family thiol-disulfide oxidoreductase YuxK
LARSAARRGPGARRRADAGQGAVADNEPVIPATVVYDGECGLCRGGIAWIRGRAVPGALEFLPCQSDERRARLPRIEEARCMEAIHLVLPDGRILAAAAAIPEILRRLRGWRWLAAVFHVPGARWLAAPTYAWVARHRYQISCLLGRARG